MPAALRLSGVQPYHMSHITSTNPPSTTLPMLSHPPTLRLPHPTHRANITFSIHQSYKRSTTHPITSQYPPTHHSPEYHPTHPNYHYIPPTSTPTLTWRPGYRPPASGGMYQRVRGTRPLGYSSASPGGSGPCAGTCVAQEISGTNKMDQYAWELSPCPNHPISPCKRPQKTLTPSAYWRMVDPCPASRGVIPIKTIHDCTYTGPSLLVRPRR